MADLTCCIPVYNAEKYLAECLESILSQTHSDFKVLAYDDGSTDGSADVIRSFNDDRVTLIDGGENRGGIWGRTQLINRIQTEYCVWCDADDRFIRLDAFEYMLDEIRNGNFDMVNLVRDISIDSNGHSGVTEKYLYDDFAYCGDRLFEKFYPADNHVRFHSKIFRTDLIRKSLPSGSDLEKRYITDDLFFAPMWFFHCKRYKHIASNEPVYEYKNDIGISGKPRHDLSPKRIAGWVKMLYSLVLSIHRRMTEVRPVSQTEIQNMLSGALVENVARAIGSTRKHYGDEYADGLVKIWHTALCEDGRHLLNGVDQFEMPKYVHILELLLQGRLS